MGGRVRRMEGAGWWQHGEDLTAMEGEVYSLECIEQNIDFYSEFEEEPELLEDDNEPSGSILYFLKLMEGFVRKNGEKGVALINKGSGKPVAEKSSGVF